MPPDHRSCGCDRAGRDSWDTTGNRYRARTRFRRGWPCGSEASRGVSCFLRLRSKGGTDGGREAIPAGGFFAQTFAARGGEFVKLGAAIVLRRAPARLEHSLPNEAKQTGIERALFDQQCIAGDLCDTQKDAVPMKRAEGDRPENEEIESAGKKVGLVGHEEPS